MKKLTIKELFSEEEQHSDKVKDSNAVDYGTDEDGTDKKIFFDEKEKIKNEITTSGPAISGSQGGFKDGAPSGAGGYNTKYAFKKTPYGKNQMQMQKRKMVPENDKTEAAEKTTSKGDGVINPKETKNSDPKTGNGSYKNTNQSKAPKSDNDGFWEEVELIPGSGYVPKGMDKNYISGMHNASAADLKKRGYAEGEKKSGALLNEDKQTTNKKPDLTRKKFFSLKENEDKGINKRYLITEKTTKEYETERWKKLSTFKLYESIKEAEEMNETIDSVYEENIDSVINSITLSKNMADNNSNDNLLNESVAPELRNAENEEVVFVEKPNSKFGIQYKFFKKDFLNEQKFFILDLNTMVYIPNPNIKK